MNKDNIIKKRCKGIYLKILFIVFFIFTVNMASGYLKSTVVSRNVEQIQKTQLASAGMALFGVPTSRKDGIHSILSSSPVSLHTISPVYFRKRK